MATKKLTNNISSNQNLIFLTARVWWKIVKIRHWNWEDAVCFVLLQAAYGQSSTDISSFISSFVTPAFSGLNSAIASGQALANSAIQQFNGNYSAVTQNLTNAIQNAATTAQQQAAALNASYPQAQQQIQACLNQQNLSLSALNSSASKLNTNVGL